MAVYQFNHSKKICKSSIFVYYHIKMLKETEKNILVVLIKIQALQIDSKNDKKN